jgi:hypothetical protein
MVWWIGSSELSSTLSSYRRCKRPFDLIISAAVIHSINVTVFQWILVYDNMQYSEQSLLWIHIWGTIIKMAVRE